MFGGGLAERVQSVDLCVSVLFMVHTKIWPRHEELSEFPNLWRYYYNAHSNCQSFHSTFLFSSTFHILIHTQKKRTYTDRCTPFLQVACCSVIYTLPYIRHSYGKDTKITEKNTNTMNMAHSLMTFTLNLYHCMLYAHRATTKKKKNIKNIWRMNNKKVPPVSKLLLLLLGRMCNVYE